MRYIALCLLAAFLTGPIGCSWFGVKDSKPDPVKPKEGTNSGGPALPPVSQLPKIDDLNKDNARTAAAVMYQQLSDEKTDALNQKESASTAKGDH